MQEMKSVWFSIALMMMEQKNMGKPQTLNLKSKVANDEWLKFLQQSNYFYSKILASAQKVTQRYSVKRCS